MTNPNPPRILLVDDHVDTTRSLARLLRLHAFDVTAATSATEARALCQSQPFDLLLSDLQLPDGDGISLLSQIRQSCPDVRAIAVTGRDPAEAQALTQAAGFNGYLLKPVPLDRLLQAVQQALESPALPTLHPPPPSGISGGSDIPV